METKKVTVKIATDKTVKRVPKAESFAQLVKTAKALTKSSDVKLSYKDEEEDIIVISDDEDLSSAYDWAVGQPGATLKLQVEVVAESSSEDESSSDDEVKMKEAVRMLAQKSVASIVESQQIDEPEPIIMDMDDKEDIQIDTCVTRATE